jgi:hypothetical protein
MEKRNCALLKTKLNINIKIKYIYCVEYIVKFIITQLDKRSAVTPGSGIDGDNIECDDCDILQCCT